MSEFKQTVFVQLPWELELIHLSHHEKIPPEASCSCFAAYWLSSQFAHYWLHRSSCIWMSKRKASWCSVVLIFISAFWFQRHLSNLINWLYQEDFLTDLTGRKQIGSEEGVVEDIFCYFAQKHFLTYWEKKINPVCHWLKWWHVPAKAKLPNFRYVKGL